MNGREFIATVSAYFGCFLRDLGFSDGRGKYSGRLYEVQFDHALYMLSVSYEPGDDYLLVVLFTQSDGRLSELDDPTKTPRLADLNARFMPLQTDEDRSENNAYFSKVVTTIEAEKRLLKCAKELRLDLKKLLA